MTKVFKQIESSLAVLSALFITVVTSRTRNHHNCRSSEELVKCAKPLSVLTDSGLTFVSNKTELDRICPDLRDAVKCVHSYTRHCMTLADRNHFRKLFHGTNTMVHELCLNETYQQEYLKHAPCMRQVEQENEVCLKQHTATMQDIESRTPYKEEPEMEGGEQANLISKQKKKRDAADQRIKSVCCAFRRYVDCSTQTMKRTCGEEASSFSKNFLGKMSSSLIHEHCREYGDLECGLRTSAAPSLAPSPSSQLLVALLSAIVMFYVVA